MLYFIFFNIQSIGDQHRPYIRQKVQGINSFNIGHDNDNTNFTIKYFIIILSFNFM